MSNEIHTVKGLMTKQQAVEFASHLSELSCVDVMLFQLSGYFDYTDFVTLCTTNSHVHSRGLIEEIPRYLNAVGLHDAANLCINKNQATKMGDWILLDLHDIIVHLMSAECRKFYELERLWIETDILVDTRTHLAI